MKRPSLQWAGAWTLDEIISRAVAIGEGSTMIQLNLLRRRMDVGGKRRPSQALAVICSLGLTFAAAATVAAANATGGAAQYGAPGSEYWCNELTCVRWTSTASSSTNWISTYYPGPYYTVAPLQQTALLVNGRDLVNAGLSPDATYSSVIKNSGGTIIRSTWRTSGSACWSAIVGSWDLYWATCDAAGVNIYTSAYPPGTATTTWNISDPGAIGGWNGSYSGWLR